jgi:hypothetical protein
MSTERDRTLKEILNDINGDTLGKAGSFSADMLINLRVLRMIS